MNKNTCHNFVVAILSPLIPSRPFVKWFPGTLVIIMLVINSIKWVPKMERAWQLWKSEISYKEWGFMTKQLVNLSLKKFLDGNFSNLEKFFYKILFFKVTFHITGLSISNFTNLITLFPFLAMILLFYNWQGCMAALNKEPGKYIVQWIQKQDSLDNIDAKISLTHGVHIYSVSQRFLIIYCNGFLKCLPSYNLLTLCVLKDGIFVFWSKFLYLEENRDH